MVRFAVRLAFIIVVALAAFGSWWLWLREPDAPDPQQTQYLYRADQSAVTGVEVTTEGRSAAFVREGDAWRFDGSPLLPVNLERWGGIVLLLSGPQIERRLPAPDDLATYGLAEPSAVIEVTIDGKDDVFVRLGDVTPDGQHYYAQVEGEDDVALVNTAWGDALRKLATAPPYPYWYYNIDSSLVRLFELERGGSVVTFLLGLPGEDGVSNRVVVNDVARDLTPEEVSGLTGLVGGPPGFAVQSDPVPAPLPQEVVIRVSYVLAEPLETRSTYSTVYRLRWHDNPNAPYLGTTQDTEAVLQFDAAWVEAVLDLLMFNAE